MSCVLTKTQQTAGGADEGSSLSGIGTKIEKEEEDFSFDEPSLKKQKTSAACHGRPTALPSSAEGFQRNELNMSWDLIEVL